MFMHKEIRAMKHIMTFASVFLWVVMMSLPALAGDIPELENVEIVDAWLTSDPQPGVRYHILKICQDQEMSVDCTRCIYKAKKNGALWIPANNRCLVRVNDDDNYQYIFLFYQIKSVIDDNQKSKWSQPQKVSVYRNISNDGMSGSRYNYVRYYWDNASYDEP
jgi:hypothetical protein